MAQVKDELSCNARQGHIRNIHIKNFVKFEGHHELSLMGDSDRVSPVVAFVGDSGAGKSTILKCLGMVNVLRLTYEAIKDEHGKFQRLKVDTDSPLACDTSCSFFAAGLCTKCVQPDMTLSDLLTGDQIHSTTITKYKEECSSFVVAEVEDVDIGCSAYYGIYANERESQWLWHYKDINGNFKYSTTFCYRPKKGIMYILSPTRVPTLHRGKLLKFSGIPPGTDINMKVMEETILKCLRGDFKAEETNSIPLSLKKLFPSNILNYNIAKHMKKQNDAELMKELLTNMQEFGANCIFVKNGFSVKSETSKTLLKNLKRHCMEQDLQIIMTTHSEDVIESDSVSCLVQFVDRGLGKWRTCKVPHDFAKKSLDRHWPPHIFLQHRSILLVEGQVDENILTALIDPIIWQDKIAVKDKCAFKKLVENTYVLQVGGKDSFHSALEFLLSHAALGLFQFVLCDADAMWGVSAKELTTCTEADIKPEDFAKVSQVLRGSKSILSTVMSYLPDDKYVQTVYDGLLEVKCGEKEVVSDCVTSTLYTTKFKELIGEIVKRNCTCTESARLFSESQLYTFAWKIEKKEGDIESVIELTTNQRPRNLKSKISKSRDYSVSIAEEMICSANTEVARLFSFIDNKILLQYQKLENKLYQK